MPTYLTTNQADFEARLAQTFSSRRQDAADLSQQVGAIIDDVRREGDAAVLRLTAKFDRLELTAEQMAFTSGEVDAAVAQVSAQQLAALDLAAQRIRDYHARQLPEDASWTDPQGAWLGWRWTAVSAAGLYVPGGTASYPSSVLMNAIPAKVAGVSRLVVCVPSPDGVINPLVLAACRVAGVSEIYRIGGAQAIAALAYGTATIAPVDKITGPGNAYVAAAKRQVFGRVGIDMIAGPSEVLIIADGGQNPEWLALDLLAQAEHDTEAQAILVTPDPHLAQAVSRQVEQIIPTLARAEIAAASWRDHGTVIVTRDLCEAATISDRFAPEHLELCVDDPEALLSEITHAGAIFLGANTPEAAGDYVSGPNHVLPTAQSARFSSGLSVLDFMKRTTLARLTPECLAEIGPAAAVLADAEGLGAHAASVRARLAALNTSAGKGE